MRMRLLPRLERKRRRRRRGGVGEASKEPSLRDGTRRAALIPFPSNLFIYYIYIEGVESSREKRKRRMPFLLFASVYIPPCQARDTN